MTRTKALKKSSTDWLTAASSIVNAEPSIGRQSLLVRQVIADFANTVARRFPPGSMLTFRVLPPRPPGLEQPGFCTTTGIVSTHQHPPADLSETGLLVSVSDETASQLGEWRRRPLRGEMFFLIGFNEIIE